MPYELCLGARSFESAVIQERYPYGRKRCLRKMWVETATKGSKSGESRVCTCTTIPEFNYDYTDNIVNKRLFLYAAGMSHNQDVQRLLQYVALPRAWNAPHHGQYKNGLVVLYRRPMETRGGEIFVRSATLTVYAKPEDFSLFEYLIGDNQLPPHQLSLRQKLEEFSRKSNGNAWAAWDALSDAERVKKMGPLISIADSEPDDKE